MQNSKCKMQNGISNLGLSNGGTRGTPGGKLLERSFPPDPLSRTFKKYNCYLTMVFKSFEDS
jgi:hypothetical protein